MRKNHDNAKNQMGGGGELGERERLIEYLVKIIVFNDPTKNCIIKGGRDNWQGLPKSKSLFYAAPGTGLPIGNLTSQLFANIYLDDFDHFAQKNCRRYGRYVDDMVFVYDNKNFLKAIIPHVREYLKNELKLTLHENKIYLQHYAKGVKFLGTIIKPWRIYIANRAKNNFRQKIEQWNNYLATINVKSKKEYNLFTINGHISGFKKEQLAKEDRKLFVSQVNSYLGLMKHYNTRKLRKKLISSWSVYFWNFVYLWYDNGKIVLRK